MAERTDPKSTPADPPSPGEAGPDVAAPRPAGSEPAGSRVTALRNRTARLLASPPRPPDHVTPWLVAAAVMCVAAFLMLLEPDQPHPLSEREAEAVQVAADTRAARAELDEGWAVERWVPREADEARLSGAPGRTWVHLVAFTGLDDEPPQARLLHRARIASAIFGILAVGAVFWAGMSAGGLATATFGSLICAANPFLLYYARLGTGDTAGVALAALAVAAALWAIRPTKPAARLMRQATGWGLAGLFLAGAGLTGGAMFVIATAGSLLLMLVIWPGRLGQLLGLTAALLVGMLLAVPWILHVHGQNPDVWRLWLEALTPTMSELPIQLAWRVGLVLTVALPWTPWLVAALVQAAGSASLNGEPRRERVFAGWVWVLVMIGGVVIARGAGAVWIVLAVVPAASLLVGQLVAEYMERSAQGRHARAWRWLRWPHAVAILLLALALPLLGYLQPLLVAEGWLEAAYTAPMHPAYWTAMGLALIGLALLGVRYVVQQYPARATISWAAWTLVAFLMFTVAR